MIDAHAAIDWSSAVSLSVFRQRLYTFSFRRSYPDLLIWHFADVVLEIMFATKQLYDNDNDNDDEEEDDDNSSNQSSSRYDVLDDDEFIPDEFRKVLSACQAV